MSRLDSRSRAAFSGWRVLTTTERGVAVGVKCPKCGCPGRAVSAESIGQVVHGNLTARSIVFNIGGSLVTPPEATDEQLEALRKAHNRAIEAFWGKSVGMAALVFAATIALASISVPWVAEHAPPPEGHVLAARLTLLALCAIVAYWFAEIFAGGWWREQRDTLRDLRRQRAAIRRELVLRKYTANTPGEG